MCVRPEPGVMASDLCSHGKASSLRSISISDSCTEQPGPARNLRRIESIGLPENCERLFEASQLHMGNADVVKHQPVPRVEAQGTRAGHQALDEIIRRTQKAAIGFQHRN